MPPHPLGSRIRSHPGTDQGATVSSRVFPDVRLRRIAVLLLSLVSLAWITSLPLAPFLRLNESSPHPQEQVLISALPTPPTWRDTLVLELAVTAPGVQQQYGVLLWTQNDQERAAFPFALLADGRVHRLVLPVGVHPGWQGRVTDLSLAFLHPDALDINITAIQHLQRPPWAIDLLLLRLCAPMVPEFPPWSHLVLLVALLLTGSLALLWPWSHWRRRLQLVSVGMGTGVGLWTIVSQILLLTVLVPQYAPLDPATAAARIQPYNEHPAAIAMLVTYGQQFPDGPIMLLDMNQTSDLLHRARYLLYPRPVEPYSPQTDPAGLTGLIAGKYVGVIERNPDAQPPVPGWERIGPADGPIALWRAPGVPPVPPRPAETGQIWLPLIAGLGLVALAGWSLAGVVGWYGGLRLTSAWPLGVSLVAGWMWLLAVSGIAWSWISIGLPLLLGSGLLLGYQWRRTGGMLPASGRPRPTLHWEQSGWLIIGVLSAAVMLQALLLPFSDRDTWRMWGLKGQAFYLDGDLAPVLTMLTRYQQNEIHHPDYPPAQPLIQTWVYLTLGGIDERLVKVIFPLWYLACVTAVGWIACQWTTRRAATGWMLLLATTPLLLDHATLANADLPVAVPLLLGSYTLSRWIEDTQPHWLVGSVLLLASAAWVKLDGTYLGAGMLMAAVLVRVLLVRSRGGSPWRMVGMGAMALAAFGALLLPWQGYIHLHQLGSSIPTPGTDPFPHRVLLWEGIRVIGAELLLSYNNSAQGLLGGGYGVLWLVSGGALVVNWQQVRRDALLGFLLLVLLGGFLFYLGSYMLQPYLSIDRYLLHLAPIAVIAAARATRPLAGPVPAAHAGSDERVAHPRVGRKPNYTTSRRPVRGRQRRSAGS